ncbi:MAG: hypothetical protein Greene071436_67 [Parcubacteria group bacterium Greene0714_36]|nr:MAG: hypothetical protein Greene071436_67 [Parcubacteria group bacterium Greene0714_36]
MLHNILILSETLFFIYTSYLAGDVFFTLTRMRSFSPRERSVYAILMGLGIFALTGFLLGLTGALNAFSLRAFIITIIAVSRTTIASHLRAFKAYSAHPLAQGASTLKNLFHEYPALKIILVLWLASNFIFAFVPITGHDTKSTHLPIIMEMVEQGAFNFSSVIPQYHWMPLFTEILYAIPIIAFSNTGDPFVFQILQYSTLLPLLMIIYNFLSRRTGQKVWALIAIVGILAITDFQRELLHGGYIDVFVYLFGIASALLVIDTCEDGSFDSKTLSLSALFLGFGLSMKQTAGVIAIIIYLFLSIGFLRHRVRPSRIFIILIKYSSLVFIIAGFWYIRNTVVFGSPFYLGGQTFAETMVSERTILNFFLFPFYKFAIISPQDSSSRFVVLGYFIISYALAAFFLLFHRKMITLSALFLFIFVQIHLALVFSISHHTRYFIPALIILPPFIALLMDRWYRVLRAYLQEHTYATLWHGSLICAHLIFIILLIGNIRYFHVKFLYKIGVLTEAEYIKQIGSQ